MEPCDYCHHTNPLELDADDRPSKVAVYEACLSESCTNLQNLQVNLRVRGTWTSKVWVIVKSVQVFGFE